MVNVMVAPPRNCHTLFACRWAGLPDASDDTMARRLAAFGRSDNGGQDCFCLLLLGCYSSPHALRNGEEEQSRHPREVAGHDGDVMVHVGDGPDERCGPECGHCLRTAAWQCAAC